MVSESLSALCYLIASICFIMALRGLSSPETARTGNIYGIAGMIIAVVTTLVTPQVVSFWLIIVGILLGGTIGNPADFGLDAIFPAFFLALLAAELDRPMVIPVVVLAGAIALAFTPILPAGLPVLLASTTALLGLWRR